MTRRARRSGSPRPGAARSGPSAARSRRRTRSSSARCYSGISRGTESLVFQRPRAAERVRADARAVSGGRLSGAGEVRLRERRRRSNEGPRDLAGRRVFVLYPHQTRYVVPAHAVHLAARRRARRRARCWRRTSRRRSTASGTPASRSAIASPVIGGGTVGCLVAWLAGGIRGCDVELVDVNPARAAVARALGVGFAAPDAAHARRRRRHSRERLAGGPCSSRCASPASKRRSSS